MGATKSTLNRLILLLTGFVSAGALRLPAQVVPVCPPSLSGKQQQSLVEYVRKRYKLADSITLVLKQQKLVRDSCYRELTFQGKGELQTWDLTLYASPDSRFLSVELFDLAVDPAEQARVEDEGVMKGLTQNATAIRGADGSLVTIVEFSDFQCPYCRKFALSLDEVLAKEEQDVRIVFRHLPIAGHDWARLGAEGAACAQLQGSRPFWSLHDQIFRNQEQITVGNVREKLNSFAQQTEGLDVNTFQRCMDNSMSLGLVLKDLNLAQANRVDATPTLFINGHRVQGVENAGRLHELIAAARKEARPVAISSQKPGRADSSAVDGTSSQR